MSEFDMPARIKRLRLPPGRRIIAVSDIHGNLPYLKGLLKKIRFDADDILIIDGDFLEKGPDSLGTLRYIMQLSEAGNVYTVCGNCDGWDDIFRMPPEADEHLLHYMMHKKCGLLWEMCNAAGIDKSSFSTASPRNGSLSPACRTPSRRKTTFSPTPPCGTTSPSPRTPPGS